MHQYQSAELSQAARDEWSEQTPVSSIHPLRLFFLLLSIATIGVVPEVQPQPVKLPYTGELSDGAPHTTGWPN